MPPVVSDQGFPQTHPVLAPLLFHLWFLEVCCHTASSCNSSPLRPLQMTRVQGGETFLTSLGGLLEGSVQFQRTCHITSSADAILMDFLCVSGVTPQWHPTLQLLLSIKTLETEPLQNCHPSLISAKYRLRCPFLLVGHS